MKERHSTERKEGPKLEEKLNGNGRKTSYVVGMKEKVNDCFFRYNSIIPRRTALIYTYNLK